MYKKSNNQIYLNQIFDSVTKFLGDVVTTSAATYTVGDTLASRWMWADDSNLWIDFMDRDFSVPCQIPTYPVSNYSVLKDGSSLIEIAVTGFAEEELSIEKIGSKIIVHGRSKKQKDSQQKYMYKHIACRDFDLEFQGADSWDYSQIEAEIDKGILSIKIPLTAESKPLEIQINKKK